MWHLVFGLSQWWGAGGTPPSVLADTDGALVVRLDCPLGSIVTQHVTDTGGVSTALTSFGGSAGARNYVSTLIAYNDSATGGFLKLLDGTGGGVIATLALPPKGGATVNFPVPLRQPTANTALAYQVNAALTTVYLTVVGFRSAA